MEAMAVVNQLTAEYVGRTFAEMVRGEQAVQRLWARHQHRDYFEFWLLTTPIEAETERRIYDAGGALRKQFSEANIRLRILNPRFFDQEDLSEQVPAGAEEIPLHQA
jgi:hypothetical protein